MGRAVGGATGAGCGAFSLVSVLVGVVLVVWLASQGMGGGDDDPVEGQQEAIDALGELPDASIPGVVPAGQVLDVAPDGPVADGTVLTVSGSGWRGEVQLLTCLAGENRVGGGLGACDESTAVVVDAAPDGLLLAQYPARRTITVLGADEDCGAAPGTCELVASTPGAPETGTAAPLELLVD